MIKVMRITIIILAIAASLCATGHTTNAQDNGKDLMQKAQNSLTQNNKAQSRALFLEAYNAFAAEENYQEATNSGTQAVSLFYRDHNYKEAFDLCRAIDQLIMTGEQQKQKQMPELHFKVARERLQMYIQLKNAEQAQGQLTRLKNYAQQANEHTVNEELLYTEANFYYTFGQPEKGDKCFQQLIAKYKEQKNYDKASECYQNLINIALKTDNTALIKQSYEKYYVWTDSIRSIKAKEEYMLLKQQYDESLQTIQDKDNSLSNKQYIIVGLCIVIAIMIALLLFGLLVLSRFMMLNKKQKQNIQIINEHNDLKRQFIQNISAQMEPSLKKLESVVDNLTATTYQQKEQIAQHVKALKNFTTNVQELSQLENTLMTPYETESINVSTFCKKLVEEMRLNCKQGVEMTVDASALEIKVNTKQLERILQYLLKNATIYTTEGKIKLEFKRRGAHICQFIVTDTGCGIPEERKENIFKPFSEIKDLSEGDGLGLPICSLIATKMNGSLTLDPEYKQGCRFVLGLNI